jgi:hypothetical protein
MALAVREFVDPTAITQFWAAILAGKNPTLVEIEDPETGETYHEVRYDERGGVPPTLEQKMRAAQEISNRGWGQPAQMIQLEAELRGQIDHTAGGLSLGALPAAAVFALKDALNARRALQGQPASVIDATATERPALPAPASGDHPASEGHVPASTTHPG